MVHGFPGKAKGYLSAVVTHGELTGSHSTGKRSERNVCQSPAQTQTCLFIEEANDITSFSVQNKQLLRL